MKRAIVTVISDTHNDVYSSELKTDRIYTFKYEDGEWIVDVKAGGQE